MNTDDLKFQLEELWTKFLNWFDATWFVVKKYFLNLDTYEHVGWGANAIALILIIVAFI